MTFQEVNLKRRSIRDFQDKPVPEELIHEVLKDAPSLSSLVRVH